jgi:hypothetical protein
MFLHHPSAVANRPEEPTHLGITGADRPENREARPWCGALPKA